MQLALLTYGNVSRLNKYGKLARLLHTLGHRVTLISSAPIADAVPDGCDFRPLPGEAALRNDTDFLRLERMNSLRRLRQHRAWHAWGDRLRRHWLQGSELADTLRAVRPAVLLIEEELTPGFITALALGLPTVVLTSLFDLTQGRDRPPLPVGVVPRQTPVGRLTTRLLWQAYRTRETLKATANRLLYPGSDRPTLWWALARRHGIDLRRHIRPGQSHPFLFHRPPWLRLTVAELEFPPVADTAAYIGPLIDSARQTASARQSAADAAEYGATIAHIAAVRGDRPLIYCALGSMLRETGFLQRVVAAARSRPEWLLLLAAGRETDRSLFEPLPPNVFVLGHVPQLDALARADVMVTHAGTGSIHEALLFGVPLVCYPTAQNDLAGNSAHVVFHRLGVRGDIRRDSPAQIAAHVANVLTSPIYRANARAMRQIYAGYDDARALDGIARALGRA